jgi:surfactin synthase thioesterase subunit
VLGELSGDHEVLTGYEHSGRPELPDAERALGLFLNTVPFRIDLAGGCWADLVRRVYQAELELLPHRRYPMARMKQDLGTQRTLFETAFNFTHFYLLKGLQELPGFGLLDMRVDSETEFVFRTEFSRHFFDDGVRLCLHYHSHLFDAEQIDRIGGYFVRVLELMTGTPAEPHDARPLLDPADLALRSGPGAAAGVPSTADGSRAEAGLPAVDLSGSAVRDEIVAVWGRVLDLPVSEIGPSAGFFDLGGNSLSALRVVLELDGLVTLTDLTRHPRLDELARMVHHRDTRAGALVHLLSSTAAGTRCALVCFPYPAGHPINFRPLADALEERTSDLAVYAVEQPGHDRDRPEPFAAVEETARRVVAELAEQVDTPLVLWGHCGGASVAVETARLLEEQGFDLRAVCIGSKLLPTRSDMAESVEMISGWSDDDIIRYLVDETGYADLDGLDRERSAFAARVFRHAVLDGYRYFLAVSERPEWTVKAPLWFVVAADDPGLAHYPGEYERWRLLADDLRLHLVDSGGHYFVRSNPAGTAELVERAAGGARTGEEA